MLGRIVGLNLDNRLAVRPRVKAQADAAVAISQNRRAGGLELFDLRHQIKNTLHLEHQIHSLTANRIAR